MAANSTMDARARRGPHPLALAYLAFFGLLIVAGAGITVFGDPHAGESVIAMDLPQSAARPIRHAVNLPANKPNAAQALTDQSQLPQAAPQAVTQQVYAGHALVADPALIENTPAGPLPRIAENGTTPMRAYAPPIAGDGHPRIAIVIGGLGISARQTTAALNGLPPGVTLAFAPYAGDTQHWVSEARNQGHEVLLEIPM